MEAINPEAEMNHFSLEVLGKERQQNMLEEQLREQRVRGRLKLRLPFGRFLAVSATILLMYFWLFV
jgi:hypothetical protein